MRKLAIVFALILLASAPMAYAAGGLVTGVAATGATSYSRVSVTVPGIVGVDVETDLAFDFGVVAHYPAPGTPASCTDVFPPGSACAAAFYTVSSSTTTATALPAPTANTGNVYTSVMCTASAGVLAVKAFVPAAWTPAGGPGFATTELRIMRSAANNGVSVGPAAATHLVVSPGLSLSTGSTLPATFGWTRADQFIDLHLQTLASETFNSGTYTADVTFTIAKL
jgi:hypothetical protein